ncbi:MAG: hypothetical protein N4A72_19580 [Bacteroidales bacterium]|jgi:hypothetical protein|nr:hypothetical protein [Bacteroidales bacterium]
MKNYISSYCKIKNGTAIVNNSEVFRSEANDLKSVVKEIYRSIKPGYAKFFKMDDISKLGFIAAELMLKDMDLKSKYSNSDIGIVLSNSSSTLVTDSEFQDTIQDNDNYFPSPAIFVYTLPNIMIGEISIRHKFQGENAFFLNEKFDSIFISNYVNSLINTEKIKACLTGWVEYSEEGYEAFIYLVEQQGNTEHTEENINIIYNK